MMWEERNHVLETALGLKPLTSEEKELVKFYFMDAIRNKNGLLETTLINLNKVRTMDETDLKEEIRKFINRDNRELEISLNTCLKNNKTLAEISECLSERTGSSFVVNGIIDKAGEMIREKLRDSKAVDF